MEDLTADVNTLDDFREEIVRTWFRRAEEHLQGTKNGLGQYQSDPRMFYSDGLIFCSITYEALLVGKFGEPHVRDNQQALSREFGKAGWATTLSGDANDAIQELWEESNRKPVEHMADQNQPAYRISDTDNLGDVLKVIYRVRSNLFHGGKELSSERNQRLIQSSCRALYGILGWVLRKEGIVDG